MGSAEHRLLWSTRDAIAGRSHRSCEHPPSVLGGGQPPPAYPLAELTLTTLSTYNIVLAKAQDVFRSARATRLARAKGVNVGKGSKRNPWPPHNAGGRGPSPGEPEDRIPG